MKRRETITLEGVSLDHLGFAQPFQSSGQTGGVIPVPPWAETCLVHFAAQGGSALGTGVIQVRRGGFNDGPFHALETDVLLGPSDEYSPVFAVDFPFMCFYVNTLEAGEFCRLAVTFTGSEV